MSIKGTLLKGVNNLLAPTGFKLDRTERDFDARLDQPDQIRRVFRELGHAAEDWLSRQNVFPVKQQSSASEALESFFDVYLTSPYRKTSGGSRFNNLAWLFLISRAMQPSLIIDSGTFKGTSAWAFALGAPHAKVLSFDIDLSNLALRANGVTYTEMDWSKFDWQAQDVSNALIYFDDHLDQARRLIEAAKVGIPVAIFDDDFPITSFAAMAHDGKALPKIEFVLDHEFRNWKELSWVDRGGRHSFQLEHDYLDNARALIEETERLPNTSLVTGIRQTPYRIVKIRSARI